MAVVYYNKKVFESLLDEQDLKLLYTCHADAKLTCIPTAFHSHENNLELQFIAKGKSIIRIDHEIYEAQQGDVVIYNAGVLHDEHAAPEIGMCFYNCGIRDLQLPNLPANHLIGADVVSILHAGDFENSVRAMFEILFEQTVHEKKYTSSICHHLLNALIILLVKQIPHEIKSTDEAKDNFWKKINGYISDHYTENLTIERLSQIVYMSESGFTHKFKKIFGMSPLNYIIGRRIGQAQSMLIHSDKSITEISTALGYENISYFNNQFKKFIGLSPQNYRKAWIGEEQFKNLDSIHRAAGIE